MSVTLTPIFFAAALIAVARFVVSSMPLMPCCVNLIVVMKVAIENGPFNKRTLLNGIESIRSWHHELMSFRPHGQHGTRSGAHHRLGNAAHDDMRQAGSTVCGEYDQVDVMRAGVADYLHFRRSLDYGFDYRPSCRPFRIENSGQGLFRRSC